MNPPACHSKVKIQNAKAALLDDIEVLNFSFCILHCRLACFGNLPRREP